MVTTMFKEGRGGEAARNESCAFRPAAETLTTRQECRVPFVCVPFNVAYPLASCPPSASQTDDAEIGGNPPAAQREFEREDANAVRRAVALERLREETTQKRLERLRDLRPVEAIAEERERANKEIRAAEDLALNELATRSAELATSLAGKIIQEKLNPAEHAKLVERVVSDITAK